MFSCNVYVDGQSRTSVEPITICTTYNSIFLPSVGHTIITVIIELSYQVSQTVCSYACSVSSNEQGQWRGGVYHGEGTMSHCSGVSYSGLWVNGRPTGKYISFLFASNELCSKISNNIYFS